MTQAPADHLRAELLREAEAEFAARSIFDRIAPGYSQRSAQWFTPPGFVDHLHVLGLLVERGTEPEGQEAEWQALNAAVVQMQGLLAQGRVAGFYVSRRVRDPGMFRLPDHFWLLAEGTTALLCGEFHDMGQPSPLLFQRGVIEAVLMALPVIGTQAKGGRPRKVDAALAVYAAIYPAGHEAAGVTWKEAVARVSSETGERIAVGTLRDALKTLR